MFGLGSGLDGSGQVVGFIWSVFRAKRTILDPFRAKFDVFGPHPDFGWPGLDLGRPWPTLADLGRLWPTFWPTLADLGPRLGPILGRPRADAGLTLGQLAAILGSTSGRLVANLGSTFGRLLANFRAAGGRRASPALPVVSRSERA